MSTKQRLIRESQIRLLERLNKEQIHFLTPIQYVDYFKGRVVNKPIIFEKELISHYNAPDIRFKTRAIGYTTMISKAAYYTDCYIVIPHMSCTGHIKGILMDIAQRDIKPTCFEKVLIWLGL